MTSNPFRSILLRAGQVCLKLAGEGNSIGIHGKPFIHQHPDLGLDRDRDRSLHIDAVLASLHQDPNFHKMTDQGVVGIPADAFDPKRVAALEVEIQKDQLLILWKTFQDGQNKILASFPLTSLAPSIIEALEDPESDSACQQPSKNL